MYYMIVLVRYDDDRTSQGGGHTVWKHSVPDCNHTPVGRVPVSRFGVGKAYICHALVSSHSATCSVRQPSLTQSLLHTSRFAEATVLLVCKRVQTHNLKTFGNYHSTVVVSYAGLLRGHERRIKTSLSANIIIIIISSDPDVR